MNRKQKVAIVVGVVVTFWIAMLPPWTGSRETFNPPTYNPPLAERSVSYGHRLRFPSDEQREAWRQDRERELFAELKDTGEIVKNVSTPELDHVRSAIETAASLALTVAAVVVLKERKG